MKSAAHKLVGRGLVAVFVALCGWSLIEIIVGKSRVASLLVILPLLSGLLLLPALLVLKQHWEQLAALVSGLVCTVLFFICIGNISDWVRLFEQYYASHLWTPFAALIILISAWVLPFKLHSLLKPRLQLIFERQPASKPAGQP